MLQKLATFKRFFIPSPFSNQKANHASIEFYRDYTWSDKPALTLGFRHNHLLLFIFMVAYGSCISKRDARL